MVRRWLPRVLGILVPVTVFAGVGSWMGLSPSRSIAVIGLALDICGVWMLASGAILSPKDADHVGTWGWPKYGRRWAVRHRVEGMSGLALTLSGFALQLFSNIL
jgi:hypothetical protein